MHEIMEGSTPLLAGEEYREKYDKVKAAIEAAVEIVSQEMKVLRDYKVRDIISIGRDNILRGVAKKINEKELLPFKIGVRYCYDYSIEPTLKIEEAFDLL